VVLSGRPHLEAPDLAAIELLIDHHLPRQARALMRLIPAQDLSDSQRLVAAYLYARLGDTFRATLLMQACDARCQALDGAAVALTYPEPWLAQVQAQSRKAHVPPALVYAIMREESGFNSEARSPRGAAGLMQLMPQTAQRLAQQAHVPVHGRKALLTPDTSIALGCQLLGQLYRHFHGNIAAVAAAYQAGQPKAQGWLNQALARGARVSLTQVIPLPSSRTYVEHIERAFTRYQELQKAPLAPKR
jgi:soluble lytic murein transglycosylase-like protein